MRVDYGLPQTSISSLLPNAKSNSQDIKQDSLGESKQHNSHPNTPKSTTSNVPKIPKTTTKDSTQNPIPHSENSKNLNAQSPQIRQTYGMGILELMSDEEYSAFVRASEGMSEGEKLLAAQALYSLRDNYQGQGSHQNAKNPYTKTNRAFSRHNDFLERYKAFYYGVEKVEILG